MIKNDDKKGQSFKNIKESAKKKEEAELKAKCEALAIDKFGEDQVIKWSNKYKGLWFLPITDEDGNIEKMAIAQPIDRHKLSYATTKIQDDGL